MSQTTATFKLPKTIKRMMTRITDPVKRANFKNAMIGAIVDGNKQPAPDSKKK